MLRLQTLSPNLFRVNFTTTHSFTSSSIIIFSLVRSLYHVTAELRDWESQEKAWAAVLVCLYVPYVSIYVLYICVLRYGMVLGTENVRVFEARVKEMSCHGHVLSAVRDKEWGFMFECMAGESVLGKASACVHN